jgi:hypothetical protein
MPSFPNLAASLGTEIAGITTAVVQNELFAAGVASVVAYPDPKFHEVMSTAAGVLEFADGAVFGFQRASSYYAVRGSQNLPQYPALLLNNRWGQEVRIGGDSGGRLDVPQPGVSSWHVDTLDGLQALASSLIEFFSTPNQRIARTVEELSTLGVFRGCSSNPLK